MVRRQRPGPALTLLLAILAGAADAADDGAGSVLTAGEMRARHPHDPARPATVAEIARTRQTSSNFWQMTGGMADHLHQRHEEIIIVLEGHAQVRVGKTRTLAGPGDVLVVPPGTPHAARVEGAETFRGISVFTPPYDPADRVPVAEPVP